MLERHTELQQHFRHLHATTASKYLLTERLVSLVTVDTKRTCRRKNTCSMVIFILKLKGRLIELLMPAYKS